MGSKRITTSMKILYFVALALAAVVVAEPEADADPHYYYGRYYGYPGYRGYYGYGYRGYYGYPYYRHFGKRDAEADPGVTPYCGYPGTPKCYVGGNHGTPEEPLQYGYKIV